ncbi:hypothetical protein GCM10010277_61750 [Streptomyces longisporoflavus]|nr:hypothetical protein GCM10010277_61750 [Streptomyces longisporoflavus]
MSELSGLSGLSEPTTRARRSRSRNVARAACVAAVLFLVMLGGAAVSQAADTHVADPPEHRTVMAQEAPSDETVEEIKQFIADIVHDFAETIKPSVTVHFAVTVAFTAVGGYGLFKIVFRPRRRSVHDHRDGYQPHCHACHDLHYGSHRTRR